MCMSHVVRVFFFLCFSRCEEDAARALGYTLRSRHNGLVNPAGNFPSIEQSTRLERITVEHSAFSTNILIKRQK